MVLSLKEWHGFRFADKAFVRSISRNFNTFSFHIKMESVLNALSFILNLQSSTYRPKFLVMLLRSLTRLKKPSPRETRRKWSWEKDTGVLSKVMSKHHNLIYQRHLWAYFCWGLPSGSLQQEVHHHIQGDPVCCQTSPYRRVGQALRLWGNQSWTKYTSSK